MAGSNIELVESVFPTKVDVAAALRGPNPGGFLRRTDLVAPDLEVTFAGSQTGAPAINYEGLPGLLEGWQDWLTPYESYVIEVEESFEAGDKVVMLVEVRARTSRDGVEITHRPAAVWTVEDGKLAAASFFLERDQAYEFAGIPAG